MRGTAMLVMLLCGCNPIDDAVDRSTEACRAEVATAVDLVKAEAWALCTDVYENYQAELEASYAQGCEQYLSGYMDTWLKGKGCLANPDRSYDCVESRLCVPEAP